MQNKKYFSLLAIIVIATSLVVAGIVFAQTNPEFSGRMGGDGQAQRSGVFGKVLAINGDTITVTSNIGPNGGTATTYTVDATNAKVTKNNTASTVASIAVGDTIMVQGTVSGTNVTATAIRDGVITGGVRVGMGVNGTVASINGTSLTVTSKARPNGGTATTYTVDASNATVTKNDAASSVSSIAVGDTIMVQGTVSGTNIIAKTIRDGVSHAQPVIQGNGQPVVAGKVTAISGSSITITNNSNVTYTIDVSNSKFVVPGVTSPTILNVAVGDNLVVQGTVNGNSVTASSVIDKKAKTNNSSNNPGKNSADFMGGIVNFFKKLFGF